MEINHVLVGSRLHAVEKKPDEVKLIFDHTADKKTYTLRFKGFIFETSGFTLNRRVQDIQLKDTLGFKTLTQLRQLQRKPENYRQLFIQLEGSSPDHKNELIGALRNYTIAKKSRPTSSLSAVAPVKKRKTPTKSG